MDSRGTNPPSKNRLVFRNTTRYNGSMKSAMITPSDVDAIAKLANIPVTSEEKKILATGFTKVIGVLEELKTAEVKRVEPVTQVTGLENITREDEIDVTHTFTQKQALANAPKTYNGYFVVSRVLE